MNALLSTTLWAAVVVTVVMTTTAFSLWFERKFAARIQSRMGPTMVGYAGLLQPFADVVKMLQKEHIVPAAGDRTLFDLAPIVTSMLAVATAAVVPFTPAMLASDLDVGVLYVLAVGGLTVLPIWVAGWASHNKFALLGGMRAVAQSVSYGVPLVLAASVPVILTGTMSVGGVVRYQSEHHWLAVWPTPLGLPAFVLFMIAMLAESNRIPFDIPEAESELIAGVTTEYTGMKFGLFYMAEYVHTLVGSAVAAALFLGGWDGPVAPGLHWMVAKTLAVFVSIYWIRWSLLRFRSDQLMTLCWKWFVPAGLVLVLGAGAWVSFGAGGAR